MKIKLLLVGKEYTRLFGFISYDVNMKINKKIYIDKYIVAYKFEAAEELKKNDIDTILNIIYETFQNGVDYNYKTPCDYKNRSLSVADIIVIDGDNYYIDDFGFKKIELEDEESEF